MKKNYKKEDLTVVWNPEKCIHSGVCAKGLPKVFNPSVRPWINLEEAEKESIRKQVLSCPSGALSLGDDE
jgi:uncharacterized Fe-S cluster protein YjdI